MHVLEAAIATSKALADEAMVHGTTLARWRMGATSASPESARKLAAAVRRRALLMLERAAELEAVANLEAEGGNR